MSPAMLWRASFLPPSAAAAVSRRSAPAARASARAITVRRRSPLSQPAERAVRSLLRPTLPLQLPLQSSLSPLLSLSLLLGDMGRPRRAVRGEARTVMGGAESDGLDGTAARVVDALSVEEKVEEKAPNGKEREKGQVEEEKEERTSLRTKAAKVSSATSRRAFRPALLVEDMPAKDVARMRLKAARIVEALEVVYPVPPKCFLDHVDPFTLLVSVVLSAQTTDVKVNQVTPALFRLAPNPVDMASLGHARILKAIRTVGLAPQKATALVGLSEMLVTEFGGRVPDNFDDLERLPGVGHKTASVVMMQAFGKPAFPVDTHIHRLACRWGCGDAKSVEKTEAMLKLWFPDETTWGALHTRIILFGREYCPAMNHDMESCSICSFAATDEARELNVASQRKFIAAAKHKDPYALREVASLKAENTRMETDDIVYTTPSDVLPVGEPVSASDQLLLAGSAGSIGTEKRVRRKRGVGVTKKATAGVSGAAAGMKVETDADPDEALEKNGPAPETAFNNVQYGVINSAQGASKTKELLVSAAEDGSGAAEETDGIFGAIGSVDGDPDRARLETTIVTKRVRPKARGLVTPKGASRKSGARTELTRVRGKKDIAVAMSDRKPSDKIAVSTAGEPPYATELPDETSESTDDYDAQVASERKLKPGALKPGNVERAEYGTEASSTVNDVDKKTDVRVKSPAENSFGDESYNASKDKLTVAKGVMSSALPEVQNPGAEASKPKTKRDGRAGAPLRGKAKRKPDAVEEDENIADGDEAVTLQAVAESRIRSNGTSRGQGRKAGQVVIPSKRGGRKKLSGTGKGNLDDFIVPPPAKRARGRADGSASLEAKGTRRSARNVKP